MSNSMDLPGGPAFPISIPGVGDNGCPGMSLRDWFAGQALAALIDRWGKSAIPSEDEIARSRRDRSIARFAYRAADAMLSERDRK